eukprot:scaffold840_cov344-Pavlova_lutheri.AAC.76
MAHETTRRDEPDGTRSNSPFRPEKEPRSKPKGCPFDRPVPIRRSVTPGRPFDFPPFEPDGRKGMKGNGETEEKALRKGVSSPRWDTRCPRVARVQRTRACRVHSRARPFFQAPSERRGRSEDGRSIPSEGAWTSIAHRLASERRPNPRK